MPLTLVTIPALSDNYTFLIHDDDSGQTAVIDVPEAPPIDAELKRRGWTLSEIWLTHHHWDHIDGVASLLESHPARVIGAARDEHRLPSLDMQVADGQTYVFANEDVQVFDVSGHTIGHIAFHLPGSKLAFTADSLMALGCGRLFEGTPEQMWDSLSKLSELDPDTQICSGHEYTAANAKFALTIDPDNADLISRVEKITAARDAGRPTVPSTLREELATNPFLRANDPDIRARLGMDDAPAAEVFAEIRRRKDAF